MQPVGLATGSLANANQLLYSLKARSQQYSASSFLHPDRPAPGSPASAISCLATLAARGCLESCKPFGRLSERPLSYHQHSAAPQPRMACMQPHNSSMSTCTPELGGYDEALAQLRQDGLLAVGVAVQARQVDDVEAAHPGRHIRLHLLIELEVQVRAQRQALRSPQLRT